MKVSVFTLGCKVNKYESDCIIRKLLERGYDVTENFEYADYYIINTCAVTLEAEKKSRQCIARAKKQNPNAKILICGCASENNASQFERDGVIYISGTAQKNILANLPDCGIVVCEIPNKYEEYGVAEPTRTRAFVKIQDGCNNFCSYCLIPYVRGRSRSREINDVVNEVRFVEKYAKEVVLTGIDISSYGKDIGTSILELLHALKDEDIRIRLGSFEVNIISDELLTKLKELKHFCPHFHLSLQSGSDEVLKTMNRHYTTDEYNAKINLIRKYYPLAGITTDVIVGFSTETDEEFKKSKKFIESVGFSDIHCFPFSRRAGTVAYKKYKALDSGIIDQRMDEMLCVKERARNDFFVKNYGIQHEILVEENTNGLYEGFSENYIKFYVEKGVVGDVITAIAYEQFKDGIR